MKHQSLLRGQGAAQWLFVSRDSLSHVDLIPTSRRPAVPLPRKVLLNKWGQIKYLVRIFDLTPFMHSECSTDVFATPISTAKAAGILVAVASGNDGYKNSMTSPACVPDAVSVGAVYDSSMGEIYWG